MRAVLVDQDPGLVVTIVGIAADMRPPVDQEHLFIALARQPLGNDASRKAGADHQPIKHSALR